ncbi:endonuclease/exonuclease/phosphatase family protein [Bacillus sp. Au-Bac7]|uniref:endonuclease/exonuclease/phosphatase family protein n=1 Tax=Bacillus sp. Au-Bac7 TaxID=2906458 RepID=UPI001E30848C|nr:endonuclease/exonuclease/phosphatase family protein [Bacillus sp. Au-Bac7]MCE4052108.1 endonuclease/exonuclease/phosphatase family protein [Bacillus sp. Au-Bac7]
MKLLTLNCHSWQEENQNEKILILVDTIKEKSYDVIALQEVNQCADEKVADENSKYKIRKDNFALVLINELKKQGVNDYFLIWEFSHLFKHFEEGLAILTKHPIVEAHSFYVSNTLDYTNWRARKIVGATIQYRDKKISFYSCHMGWWHDEEEPFKPQADKLFKKINIGEERISFLMGDFNNDAFIKGEGYDYLVSHGLFDTYNLATSKDDGITVIGEIGGWEGNLKKKRIDLIFINKLLSVTYSNVIFNGENKQVVSDHFGVEIGVNLED